MAEWYPDCGMSYPQYLQAHSFVRDVTGAVRTIGEKVTTAVSDQTSKIVANHQELAEAFGAGVDSINDSLSAGFDQVTSAMQDVSISIESLRSDFNYTMGLAIEQLQVQNIALHNLIEKLDVINKTLQSPTLTQAREFYRIGSDRLAKGLLDKALEAFLAAAEKNDADFFTQFRIGSLYLYGVDADDALVHPEKARQHFLLAARYAKAEMSIDPSFSRLAADALLNASIAVYAQLGDPEVVGHADSRAAHLSEAKRLAKEASSLNPRLSEAAYHVAKFSALLGDEPQAVAELERAIALDRNYAGKAIFDGAFYDIEGTLVAFLSRLVNDAKLRSGASTAAASGAIENLTAWHPEESQTLREEWSQCRQRHDSAIASSASGTYFAYLDAATEAEMARQAAEKLLERRVVEMRRSIEVAVQQTRDAFVPLRYEEWIAVQVTSETSVAADKLREDHLAEIQVAEERLATDAPSYATYNDLLTRVQASCSAAAKFQDALKSYRHEKIRVEERNSLAQRLALRCGGYGAGAGVLVGGFVGCATSAANYAPKGSIPTDYFAGYGLLIGAMVGVVVGLIGANSYPDFSKKLFGVE